MTMLEAHIQGLIQGLTEFLPVSSSGHLSLFQYFTGRSSESSLSFSVMLHFGTLIAVFIAFWPTILGLIREFFAMAGEIARGKFSLRHLNGRRRMILLLLLSILPLFIMFFLKDLVAGFSTDNGIMVEGFCFLFTGCLLWMADRCAKGHKKAGTMAPRDALAMGVAQTLATMPGISRSGSTLTAGLLCGLDRSYAVAFSFIMGIPAVLGANILDLADAVKAQEPLFSLPLLVGVAVAALSGLAAIKLVSYLVASDKLRIFAWYTLTLGSLTVLLGAVERLAGHPLQQLISGIFR